MSNQTPEHNCILFKDGIPGFDDIREYSLYHEDDGDTLWSLQAADSAVPSFVVINPYAILPDYNPVLSSADLESIGNPEPADLCVLVVAAIREELSQSMVNLKAPIIINVRTREGRQVVLEDSSYPIRYPLFAQKS